MAEKFDVIELGSMQEHYQEFKKLNTGICPFCGLSTMTAEVLVEPDEGAELPEEIQRRASYDHYLPKAHYPFLAVDFNNLIPCCDTCNEDFKEEKDALMDEGERTLSFKPYSPELVSLQANYRKSSGGFYKMRISIENTECDRERKGQTWDRLFQVIGRVNRIFDESFAEDWIAPLLIDVHDVMEAKRRLHIEADRLEARKKIVKEAYYKSLSFSYLASSENDLVEDLVNTVTEIYSPRLGAL